MLMTGCANQYFGIPGLFMQMAENITDPDFYEGYEELFDADDWDWEDWEDWDEDDWDDWDDDDWDDDDWDDDDWDDDDRDDDDSQSASAPGTTTIMLYINGSNLETDGGAASTDIVEILDAGYSEDINVVIQTMGTKRWSAMTGIASDRTQTYVVGKDGLELVRDDLGQLDCTVADTLYDFIDYSAEAYPADRYMLVLWDHGGGPAYGFGWDEFQDDYDNLSVDEMIEALDKSDVHFDVIGFDACIMSCLEITYALRNYCDYMILSEDFESCLGWYYTDWLSALYDNPRLSTIDIGKMIIDDMVEKNETDRFDGDRAILAMIDESRMDRLWRTWIRFAYDSEETLLNTNFSQEIESSGKGEKLYLKRSGFLGQLIDDAIDYLLDQSGYGEQIEDILEALDEISDAYISDYCITDLMSLAAIVDSEYSERLVMEVDKAIVYVNATSDCMNLTGISITLPYNDKGLCKELVQVLRNCSFDEEYLEWLKQFVFREQTQERNIDWEQLGSELWHEWDDLGSTDIWGEW